LGYDIISSKTKKDWFDKGSLHHIQCQYAYQPVFKRALGYDIKELHGRLLKKNIPNYIKELDKIIDILRNDNVDVPMFAGNLANCNKNRLANEFEELKYLISNGKIRYVDIS